MKNRKKWDDKYSCAMMLSFNLDAQYFGKIYYPDVNVDEGDILRLGQTGMNFGLPKILDMLDKYNVKGTFFVPGAVAREYEDKIKDISERGHEIGCHGDYHENFCQIDLSTQREVIRNATKALKDITGTRPVGFRMPEGEMSEDTLKILKEESYEYSSSLSDDDVPYIDVESGLVEIPIHWENFDLPYFVFTFDPPIPPGQSRSANMNEVLENWMTEIDGAKKYGTLCVFQFDPQGIGEQGRIFMLEKLLERITQDERIWCAKGMEICDKYKEEN